MRQRKFLVTWKQRNGPSGQNWSCHFRWYSRYKQTLWEVDCHIRGEADHSVSDSDRKGEEGGEPWRGQYFKRLSLLSGVDGWSEQGQGQNNFLGEFALLLWHRYQGEQLVSAQSAFCCISSSYTSLINIFYTWCAKLQKCFPDGRSSPLSLLTRPFRMGFILCLP